MDKKALNKKLAEWAGFRKVSKLWDGRLEAYPPNSDWFDLLPDFTQSLDECFAELVPKARKECGVTKIDFCYIGDKVGCRLSGGCGALLELSRALAETEALALCLAIEKMAGLDRGGQDGS